MYSILERLENIEHILERTYSDPAVYRGKKADKRTKESKADPITFYKLNASNMEQIKTIIDDKDNIDSIFYNDAFNNFDANLLDILVKNNKSTGVFTEKELENFVEIEYNKKNNSDEYKKLKKKRATYEEGIERFYTDLFVFIKIFLKDTRYVEKVRGRF